MEGTLKKETDERNGNAIANQLENWSREREGIIYE